MFLALTIWMTIGFLVVAMDVERLAAAFSDDQTIQLLPTWVRIAALAITACVGAFAWPWLVAEWNGYRWK